MQFSPPRPVAFPSTRRFAHHGRGVAEVPESGLTGLGFNERGGCGTLRLYFDLGSPSPGPYVPGFLYLT